jgi:Ca-activated chloride channel family protein
MTMNDERLRRLADTLDVPAPDPAARQRALDTAVAEFERAARESSSVRQGSGRDTRLTRAAHRMWALLTGGTPMKRTHAVAGGLVLATLAVAVLLPLLPRPTDRDDRLTLEYGVAQVAPVDSASPAGDRRNEAGPLSATPETPAIAGRDQPSFGISQRTDVAAATEAAPAAMARSKPALAAPALPPAPVYQDVGRDRFDAGTPNPVKVAAEEPVSTFSVDVDTASYAFVRRELNRGVLRQKAAVRIEEFVNYFDYDYPLPDSRDTPFRATVVVYPTPWNPATRLVQIHERPR